MNVTGAKGCVVVNKEKLTMYTHILAHVPVGMYGRVPQGVCMHVLVCINVPEK